MSGMTRVRGKGHTTIQTITRPANTTTYTAGDVIGTASSATMTFNNASFGEFDVGIIQQAIISSSAYVTPPPDLELWLFDATVADIADNAAFTPTDAEMATLVGIISFATANWKVANATAGAGGNAVCASGNLGIPFNTLKGKHSLFGVLVARNAYVPVSAEVFTVRLQILD